MAGLVVGIRLAGLKSHVIGIRVADRVVANAWAISRMVRQTRHLIGVADSSNIRAQHIELWHDDFGEGYAIPTEAGTRAVEMMAEHEGITLENTYTGKTLAGLIHYITAYGYEDEPILFWHTYGTT